MTMNGISPIGFSDLKDLTNVVSRESVRIKLSLAKVNDKIKRIVESIKEVNTVHTVDTQIMGEKIFIDIVIDIDGTESAAKANSVANKVRETFTPSAQKIVEIRVRFKDL